MCVEDHAIVREGLRLLIDRDECMKVVAVANDGKDAVQLYGRVKPDVTLMDLHLPVMSGLEAVKEIRREDPHARIVILTVSHADEDIYRAIEAGAAAYVVKDALVSQLGDVIKRVHAGERVVTPEHLNMVERRSKRPALSHRELQVLQLMSKGLRNKDIASSLGIGTETVQGYIKTMFAKLEVNDRTAAVNIGLRRGHIHLEDET
jgi:two-component system NarL family response regulator